MAAIFAARQKGETVTAAYTMDDMADDAAGLLDALAFPAAHIVGASMGGMIAQAFALGHPSRTLTLTSIMSSTGNPDLPGPTPQAQAALLTPVPSDRDAYIEHRVMSARAIGCKPDWFDEDAVRAMAGPTFDRSFYPAGVARQMAAIAASGSRREALARVTAPTLVIHGSLDALVPPAAGEDTAAAIPGAELLIVDGMGHDLPRPAWPEIVGAIARHTSRVPVA
jgi:pimeloyl-ACP methyl ester carboxylesterase